MSGHMVNVTGFKSYWSETVVWGTIMFLKITEQNQDIELYIQHDFNCVQYS